MYNIEWNVMHTSHDFWVHIFNIWNFAVDSEFVEKQKKVLSLFFLPNQLETNAEYFKIAKEYDIEANIENYTVSEFRKNKITK